MPEDERRPSGPTSRNEKMQRNRPGVEARAKRKRPGSDLRGPPGHCQRHDCLPEQAVLDAQHLAGPHIDQDGVVADPDPLAADGRIGQAIAEPVEIVGRRVPAAGQTVAKRPAADVPAARVAIGAGAIALRGVEALTIAALVVVRAALVAIAILPALPRTTPVIAIPAVAATIIASPIPAAVAILPAAVPVLTTTIVVAVAAWTALIGTTLIAAILATAIRATVTIRAAIAVATIPVLLARRLRLWSLAGLRGRRRLGRGTRSATVPVWPPTAITTAIAAIASITARLAALLLALPFITTLATAAITTIAARAVLPLFALSDHRPGGSGFRRHAAQQRQGHGGRDQTLHFVLQGALCAAPALSLDSNISCRG